MDNMIEVLAERLPMHYVTTAVKRFTYEQTGGFYATEYAEDWIMWARIASKFSFAYDPEILGLYSIHTAGSVSRKSFADGSFVQDFLRSREIIWYISRERKAQGPRSGKTRMQTRLCTEPQSTTFHFAIKARSLTLSLPRIEPIREEPDHHQRQHRPRPRQARARPAPQLISTTTTAPVHIHR